MPMSIEGGPAWRAGGTIIPSTLVKIDVTADNQVVACSATTDVPIGVAQEGMKGTPGVAGSDNTIAAILGDQIQIIPAGSVALVKAGATITRGDRIRTSAGALALTVVGAGVGQWNVVGFALASAITNDLFSMYVLPHQITQ